MNTVLLFVIAASLVIMAAALAYTGVTAYRLYKQVRGIQELLEPHLQEFTRKQAQTTELLSSIERRQGDLSGRMQRATASASTLGYLFSEFGEARDKLRGY
ncbi:MAG TPA: hypothetical protein VFD74_08130 [Thermoleophilia bacterium]|nr:hypothetical protein [Thermoleophilia bacterium]